MSEPFKLTHKYGVTYLRFPPWDEKGLIGHGFSTRIGGVSSGVFSSLNLGTRGGDNPSLVQTNRKKFMAVWGKDERQLVCGEQVHGIETMAIEKAVFSQKMQEVPGVDALITAEEEVVLGGFCADCLLVYFLEPKIPAIGLVHAGWRGTCGGIMEKVVVSMQEKYSARPENLQVLFSPSIKVGCYEVGEEVMGYSNNTPYKDVTVFLKGRGGGRFYLDIPETNRKILLRSGVDPGNIYISNYCTHCYPDLFYSFRGAGGTLTGSMLGVIFLNRNANGGCQKHA